MLAPLVLAAIASLGQAVATMNMYDCEDWFLVDDSGFQQVAYDGTNLCVLDLQGGLLCSNSISTPVAWTTIPGNYAEIGLGGGKLYARETDYEGTFRVASLDLGSYKAVELDTTVNLWYGHEVQTQFTTDGHTLCEATSAGRFVCSDATSSAPTSYTWFTLETGKIVASAVSGSTVFGVDAAGHLFQGSVSNGASGSEHWHAVPTDQSWFQLAFDGRHVCAIDAARHMYCATPAEAASSSQCCFKNGDVISLQADTSKYLARCNGCIPGGAYIDSATVHATNPAYSPWAQWKVSNLPNGKISLQADTGRYLARCNGCAPRAAYPDEAFVHSTDPNTPWSQWKCVDAGNGNIGLQSDTGNYLARCNGCVGGAAYPDTAMVHATSPSNGAHAQWKVFQNGAAAATRCAAKQWHWKGLDGEWTSVALAKDQLFAIDAAHRLYTRRLSASATH